MAPERSPAFQFYPKDFISDSNVVAMTLAERGAYITLLCICWMEGSIPSAIPALARLCRVPSTAFMRLWPALAPCFRAANGTEGRLIQPRIERERLKQATYRALKAEAGQKGGRCKAQGKQTPSKRLANESPPSSSSSSSAVSDLQPSGKDGPSARSKRPVFTGQRFAVFEWQLDDLQRMLGPHADAFDLHAWFFELDSRVAQTGQVIPQRDGGAWLQAHTLAEAQRRGLVVASGQAPPQNKRIAGLIAGGERFLRGETP